MKDEQKETVQAPPSNGNGGIVTIFAGLTVLLAAAVVALSIALAAQDSSTMTITSLTTSTVELPTQTAPYGENICEDSKDDAYLPNVACYDELGEVADLALGASEQSGANVTLGYQGEYDTGDRVPMTEPFWKEGLCPVNVHWHLGTEHLSVGEYDENGAGPSVDHEEETDDDHHTTTEEDTDDSTTNTTETDGHHRALSGDARAGYRCHYYDETKPKFTTEYEWKYCENMVIGETYEVHWPHSNMGACGTVNQFQTPFLDGVMCNFASDFGGSLEGAKIGVQAQIFTIVNDEDYYYPDLLHGMIVDGDMGADVAKYTGSTTGTSRDNEVCSQYSGITWQVNRKCHLISASSFDKLCADMKSQRDDMTDDMSPHGSRELVDDALAADNQVRLLRGNL
eukprot:Nitzschia sp. Nitz4//scaffold29_size155292//133961//135151//NITZ4_002687-RA/size155292-processed-gene-0.60-mRNA-1//-1//CDS//3329546535//2683//frame0